MDIDLFFPYRKDNKINRYYMLRNITEPLANVMDVISEPSTTVITEPVDNVTLANPIVALKSTAFPFWSIPVNADTMQAVFTVKPLQLPVVGVVLATTLQPVYPAV
jgi:hypothetical protein